MERVFRLFDFNIYNDKGGEHSDDEECEYKDTSSFMIQMFGINESGATCSIRVEEYKPFFYVKVDENWNKMLKNNFLEHIKSKMGNYYKDCIVDCKLIERKKLYGFDGSKLHKFIMFKFANLNAFNKAKNIWYTSSENEDGEKERALIKKGYKYRETYTELYEANIPPLLRFFHIQEISPSGWIALPNKKTVEITNSDKTTTCNFEFIINYKNIIPLNDKESRVPYKIMSFDIEASSSHGDFPVPIKSYKKLATNIADYFEKMDTVNITKETCKNVLVSIIKTAFGYDTLKNIDLVYPKEPVKTIEELETRMTNWFLTKVRDYNNKTYDEHSIEAAFETMYKELNKKDDGNNDDDVDTDENNASDDKNNNAPGETEERFAYNKFTHQQETYKNKQSTIVDIMCDQKFDRQGKINELILSLRSSFPPLEGDKITFIGSTFLRYGEQDPYLNHCIALNSCDDMPIQNSQIESYDTEKEVLLAWRDLVQRENPDIIIGYNIFSFDYEFMFRRSQECDCMEEFLKLSRNEDEMCATKNYKTGRYEIDKSSITLASGTYDLSIVKMTGRLQIDMLNWFRRTENLTSYKLDYVGGYFIGDEVKGLEQTTLLGSGSGEQITKIKTNNMTGLQEQSYIHFEEINHSSDYYKDGQKFKVLQVNKAEKWFSISGHENPSAKKVKWGLAKDDVTPKDIFRMTNEGPAARSVIAKYCIQDCNLVHYLMNKVDVMTDLIEMSKLCSVPMSFLIFRGQGIKLTSYVAKKCREKRTLMPVINKGSKDDGYEGAIVLEPKCGLYLDKPIAVGDFASLYPSSMLSENLCPSSKVWTKIYDLHNNMVEESGEKDDAGNYKYDNLPDYEYVDITFDTFRYVRKTPKASAEKVKSGYKVCRFAQFKEGKAIMPSILEELLGARKTTRKLIPLQSDEFMKNVLDKRQLAYKVTANSLYGQLGAKTSTFYEPDIAASTTATGRLLLTYAKKVVEECYQETVVDSKIGPVLTKAEYVYGDSVANYTPVYVKVNNEFTICTIEELAANYGHNLWKKCSEQGKQEKEFCELNGVHVETWTEKGWTKIHRVIRHVLAPHKKMLRIVTNTGLVDVTDDHSLVKSTGEEISPNDVTLGTELLHHNLPEGTYNYDFTHENQEKYKHLNPLIKTSIPHIQSISIKNSHLRMAQICAHVQSRGMYFDIKPSNILNKYYLRTNHFKTKRHDIVPVVIHKTELQYSGYVYDLTTENHHFAAGIGNMIVHNTDSVFFTFNLQNKDTHEPIVGPTALELSIEIAQEACHMVSSFLKAPHDFEYEKTFMPFCLLSKKRYVGILYEHDPTKGKRKEMGIVLKRRDNAPIVKDVYGGVIDILMKEQNIQKAIEFLQNSLQELVDGNVPIEKLIITKSLNSFYKKPQQIAHKVLADRIATRDPGNKPTSGDRIPFVYIVNSNKKALQGEKIETPTFIKENNISIDYSFYITNQIMKPLLQLFGLVLEDIWKMQHKTSKISKFKKEIDVVKKTIEDPKKAEDKINKLKDKEVKTLLFDKYLRETNNSKEGNQSLSKFFGSNKK